MLSRQQHTAKEGFGPGTQNRALAAAARVPEHRDSPGSARLPGCEAAAPEGPRLEVMKGYALSLEAVGGGDAAEVTEGEERGLRLQHTPKVLEPESHCLSAAQRRGTNCPKCFSLPP